MRDTVGLAAIKLGLSPEDLTAGAVPAVPRAGRHGGEGRDRPPARGQLLRRPRWLAGDAVVGMAWSGDVPSLLQPDQ